jgi:hypothetical protein
VPLYVSSAVAAKVLPAATKLAMLSNPMQNDFIYDSFVSADENRRHNSKFALIMLRILLVMWQAFRALQQAANL